MQNITITMAKELSAIAAAPVFRSKTSTVLRCTARISMARMPASATRSEAMPHAYRLEMHAWLAPP